MAENTVDYSQKWWVMLSVAMGVFLSTIDGSIVQVALPTLKRELNTNYATVQWVIVSYLLVLSSMMLGVARLADMIGKKRIYMVGMVIFTVGSVLCGLAPTVGFLIGFRVLQGVGAVMLQALGAAIVTEAFPDSERGRALGVIGTVVSLGIITGPTLGGLLIGLVNWRAIFLVNLPVGVIGLFLVRRFVPDWRPPGGQRFDTAGAVVLLLTLVALALGLTFAPSTGWGDPLIILLLGGALVGLGVFLGVEDRLRQPMVDLSLFRDPLFSVSLATGLLVFVAVSARVVLPFYLEEVQGYSTAKAGLFLTIIPIALGIMAPISGTLSDRYGSRGIALLGLAVMGVGCLAVATLQADTSTLGYIVRLAPFGIGAGLFQSPNNSAIMGSAPRERLGVASGLLALSRNMGQVIGIPMIGAVFSSRVISVAGLARDFDAADAPPWAIVEGVSAAYIAAALLIGVGVGLAGWALAYQRRRRSAVPEM